MIVGALLDAGVRLEDLRAQLRKLDLPGYTLTMERVTRGGLAGIKFNVNLDENAPAAEAGPAHEREDHNHEHEHEHEHEHPAEPAGHQHGHRNLQDIFHLLDHAKLAERIDRRARMIFRRLGEAEARAHGVSIDQVHFHEVGAVDSIVDIIGAVIALELLGVETIHCSPIPLGTGTVRSEHVLLPLPAPATAGLMLEGVIAPSDFPKELCTPTGAAILTTLAESFCPLPAMALKAIGYGAGGRDDTGRVNMLRVFLGQAGPDTQADTVVELAANIDDTPGQVLGAVIEMLLAAGALDAWTAPIAMKKSRPAVQVGVLCNPGDVDKLEEILFRQTTTIGIRRHTCSRTKLARRYVTVETPYGPVRVKVSFAGGSEYSATPEFDDCLQAGLTHHVPIKEVQLAAIELYRRAKAL